MIIAGDETSIMALRKTGVRAVGVWAWFAAQGCAEPCVDDGLLQDPGDDQDCPALASNEGTASETESESQTETVTATEGDGNCNNGIQDGDETDVDCGGSCSADCGNGQGCDSAEDCIAGVCNDDGTCEPPSCMDGVQNGDETDVDCGGECPNQCDDGDGCDEDADCVSMNCDEETGMCLPPANNCSDGMQNGDETDVDCGGSCPDKCDDGEGCDDDTDCMSMNCDEETGTCLPPDGCSDGMQNGDETDVDCGGSCPDDCEDGEGCEDDDDCISMDCHPGMMICQPGTSCSDGMLNGDETDVDCGGSCPDDCEDGEDCLVGDDCISTICDPDALTCSAPACDDGVQNGDESDLDCGGSCGNTCETGEDCNTGADCVDDVCTPGDLTCAAALAVDAAPACVDFAGAPVQLTAMASGGTGNYTYDWSPPAGLDDPTSATPFASPAGFVSYTVTVDDGVNQAQDTATVVNATAFDLQNNCNLYQGVFLGNTGLATITYSQAGTRACEQGNNDFGLHLCEDVVFQDVQLQGILEVTNDGNDDDIIGLVWGAQDSSTFYSLSWKRVQQNFFGCAVPAGIVVKRVEALNFVALNGADVYCPNDTLGSTLLLDPSETTTDGWEEGEEYLVTIDYLTTGSSVTVTRVSDNAVIASFDVDDTTFESGFFGSTTISQQNACVGPLNASCL
jgi:hypothetical protein